MDLTWYEFLLFCHISAAAIWLGGAAMIQFFALRALRSDDAERLATLGADVEWIGTRVLTPASAIVVLAGIGMIIDFEGWSFGDDWIVMALILFAVTFAAGLFFFGPEGGRIGKLIRERGPADAEVQARIRRLLALTRADIVLLFLIVFDMIVKPEYGDVGTIVVALLVAAVLAGLLVWHGMRMPIASAPRRA